MAQFSFHFVADFRCYVHPKNERANKTENLDCPKLMNVFELHLCCVYLLLFFTFFHMWGSVGDRGSNWHNPAILISLRLL